MEKIPVDRNAFLYPMPVVLVGTRSSGQVNFLTVAWVSRVNYSPPLIAVSLGKTHFSSAGIRECREFSVCIPGKDLLEKVDCCGLVSGKRADKSGLFDVFYGELGCAPMISQCPLCMECRLLETVDLPTNDIFIGEILSAWTEERYLTDGKPDVRKMEPVTLTMPDNRYWSVGEAIGKAWHDGKGVLSRLKGKKT
jgi:flavin reductase (DIM6/NTAB) family NADH-FMN oxidoreductase RutF